MKNIGSKRGFTLVEIMVALTVTGILMTGVMSFYIQNLKSMYASDQRMKLAGQIKRFSNELITQASRSNQFALFKSADPANFDGINAAQASATYPDRQIIDVTDPTNPLHPAGDFVVFIYYEIPKPVSQAFHRISRLEGYFLTTATAGAPGELKKVVIDLTSAPSTSTVEAILTAKWNTTAVFTRYFPLVRGLAKPEVIDGTAVTGVTTPRIFYMSNARNVIITGQIYTSNKSTDTGDWKTYTDTFAFTITPRT